MATEKILVIGSQGQIGLELTQELRTIFGENNVIASDVKLPEIDNGLFEILDVMDKNRLNEVFKKHGVTQVYLLAALLSATAEKNPRFAWDLNMEGLFNVLNAAKEGIIKKVYWPSSIAVFGPTTPKQQTPQYTVMEPNTIYGISKLAGERYCEYYHQKFGVDVRSIRYPGLIGYKSAPGGGTTDYAVHIYHEAIKNKAYTSFLNAETELPMMYMPDALQATIGLMEAAADKVKIRSSYNVAGMSFNPEQIAAAIRKHIPEFKIDYNPDFRQAIADSWPQSINDSFAKEHWGWQPKFNLETMTEDMLNNLKGH
ncbi:MAG: NAD-dependent epimerase/dehydratase family protein [Bacteroidia bacterium]|nr:NAD-dependent epimerase/dehydratase family protein [Bacteroidia bacterium]MCC7534322.1 NAD-dependent epimerase/dehydratase family protein [Bacteroidia bacterium]